MARVSPGLSYSEDISLGGRLVANWPTIVIALTAVFIISRINSFVRGLKGVGYLAGPRSPFGPLTIPGVLVPTSWWNPGLFFIWHWRKHYYKDRGLEHVGFVPWLLGKPTIISSNLEATRQVTLGGHRSSWGKPIGVLVFGMNLGAAEGEVWRKHRRIVGPAFNSALYQFVWHETSRTYNEMLEVEGWSNKDTFEVSSVQDMVFQLALLIIGNCGFGFSFNWHDPPTAPDGSMSIQQALSFITHWISLDTFFPKWIIKLPIPVFNKYRASCDKVKDFMYAQIAERREMIQGGTQLGNDVFTMLVKANDDEEAKFRLSDEELIGNVFVLLLAGHETTAHTLAATLGLLALHEDIQEEVYEEINSVIGKRAPVLSDWSSLEKVVAVFWEALRLYPSAFILIREALEDTVLQLPNPVGQEGTTSLPVHKGTQFIVDMIGLQYNPRYFDEPEKFKPQRWWGVSKESEDALSAFSIGPRACLGRRFATLEAICFLSSLLRDWKIEPILNSGETKEQWKERIFEVTFGLTMGVKDIPVRFTRRN